MRILITGGAGFIGSHTAEGLLARGIDVTAFDDLSTGSTDNLQGVIGRLRFLRGDILDYEALVKAMEGCSAVLHLAAVVSVPQSITDPQKANAVNGTGTLHVLEAARALGIKRVVLASSAAIYGGNPNLPLNENATPESLSPYAAQKWLGEVYSSVYTHIHGLDPIALRYFNVFGPRQDPASPYSGVLSKFIAAALQGQTPTIFGDGGQTRDFVFVKDVAQANILALTAEACPPARAFNVGSGTSTTVLEAHGRIGREIGTAGLACFAAARKGDIRHSLADIDLARRHLGYDPQFSFADGIARTVAWARAARPPVEAARVTA